MYELPWDRAGNAAYLLKEPHTEHMHLHGISAVTRDKRTAFKILGELFDWRSKLALIWHSFKQLLHTECLKGTWHIGVEGLDILAWQEAPDQVLKFHIYLYNQAYTYMTIDITGTHTSQISRKFIFVADSAECLPLSLSLY